MSVDFPVFQTAPNWAATRQDFADPALEVQRMETSNIHIYRCLFVRDLKSWTPGHGVQHFEEILSWVNWLRRSVWSIIHTVLFYDL